jgi:Heparinase II/III-like protein
MTSSLNHRFPKLSRAFRPLAFALPLAFAIPLRAAPLSAQIDSLLDGMRAAHPRLMMMPGDLDRLRSLAAQRDSLDQVLRYCRKRADSMLTAPPLAYTVANGQLLDVSRGVLDRVSLLAFLAVYDSDQRYAARAWRELDSASRFPDWYPSHFLDVAEMGAAFAIGYDWLYAYLTPVQRGAIRSALRSKAFLPAIQEFDRKAFWVASRSNWNIVCNSGLVLAGLAVADEDTLARQVIKRAGGSLESSGSLAAFAPDGAYAEGIGYWAYSGRYLAMLMRALKTALGSDFGLTSLPGLGETGLFPIYSEGPTGRMANFGDASDARQYPYWMAGLAQAFQNPVYAWYSQTHKGLSVFDILWYDARLQSPSQAGLHPTKRFRGPEIAVLREAWGDTAGAWIALKAGNSRNEHTHLDAGSFVYEALGRRWAMQLGPDAYSLPGYFLDYNDSVTRYTYYRVRAEGHNTLVINPGPGPDQNANGVSTLTQFDPDGRTAIADLTPAYAGKAVRARRGVALRPGGAAWIQDEVELAAAGTIAWRMHTEAAIAVSSDGRSATLTLGGKRVWAGLVSPAGARLSVVAAQPDALSPHPAGQSANPGISVLQVRLANAKQAAIAVWLVPQRDGQAPPSVFPAIDPLDSKAWNPSPVLNPGPRTGPKLSVSRGSAGLTISVGSPGPFRLDWRDARGVLFRSLRGNGPAEWQTDPARAPDFGFLILESAGKKAAAIPLPRSGAH